MTDVAATPAPTEHAGTARRASSRCAASGAAKARRLPISLLSGVVILAVWWVVSALRLVPHLFPANAGGSL